MENNKHLIVGPEDSAWENAKVEVTVPSKDCTCKPIKPEFPPTVEPVVPPIPNPDDEEVPPIGICPPNKPPHCPPPHPKHPHPHPPTMCPPNLGLGDPCCEDDPRFIIKRVILLERGLKKIIDRLDNLNTDVDTKLDDFENTIKENLDNFSKNICDANKMMADDIKGMSNRMEILEALVPEIEKIPDICTRLDQLEVCCESSREFMDDVDKRFTQAYENINDMSNELKDEIADAERIANNAEQLIIGEDGVQARLMMTDRRITQEVSTLETKLNQFKFNLQTNIEEVSANVKDISTIRNNVSYLKTYSKQVDDWIADANKKFIKIDKDIVDLTKEVESLQ